MRELSPFISWLSPGGYSRSCYTLVLFLLRFTPSLTVSNCITSSELKNNVIVTSLLNLHDETTNCGRVNLRALQQRAIIEKTVTEINSNLMFSEAMRLSANVVDTCSTQDQGLNAALKSLLATNQTCVNAPLLLGFIGPENINQLITVQQVTSSLQKFHVLPYTLNSISGNDEDGKETPSSDSSSVLYIGNSRTAIRSKIILAVLNQMRWKSVYAVVGEDSSNTMVTLRYLLTETDRLCVTGLSKVPKRLSKMDDADRIFYNDLIREYRGSGAEGLLILADAVTDVMPLLNIMRDSSLLSSTDLPNPSILLYLNKVGLKSWELPLNYSILSLIESSEILGVHSRDLLMQSSNTRQSNALTRKYYEQYEVDLKRDAFVDILDSTVIALQYAIKLFWNAAKYARNIKCRLGYLTLSSDGGICPEMYNTTITEWKSFLYKATFHDVTTMRKVSLRMNIPVQVRMYMTDAIVNSPRLVGRITDMGITELHVNLANTFSKSPELEGRLQYPKRCLSPTVAGGSRVPPENKMPDDTMDYGFNPGRETNLLANIMAYGRSLFHLDESVIEKTPYINLVILCSVAVVVFFTCLTLVVKCVYKTFKVESNEEREQSITRKYGASRNLSTVSTYIDRTDMTGTSYLPYRSAYGSNANCNKSSVAYA